MRTRDHTYSFPIDGDGSWYMAGHGAKGGWWFPFVLSSDVGFILLEESHGHRQRIATERVAQLLRHHNLEDRGLTAPLCFAGCAQRGTYILQSFDDDALGAHGTGDGGEARVL